VSVYVSWSYPAEANRSPAELDNRFSTMTEVRRVAWPAYEVPRFADPLQFQQGISGALRQGVLYGRFLDHIGDEDAQKVAHPGLALRRVSIQLIREVLAEPCELDASRADKLFTLLAKEVWLVEERGPYLVHRPELRKVMLKAMQHDKEHAARLRRVHEAAARWYEAQRLL